MCLACSSWFHRRVAPHIVHFGCSAEAFSHMRRRMIPSAEGRVVEVGFGSGLNLLYYDPAKVKHLIGIDPDETMLSLTRCVEEMIPFRLDLLKACGEDIPLADAYADTIVISYAMCTIPAPLAALAEIHRILKPGGRLIFLEHGEMECGWRRRIQAGLNGLWEILAGGCHLTRNPLSLLKEAGFDILDVRHERFPPALWLLGNHYGGIAHRPTSWL